MSLELEWPWIWVLLPLPLLVYWLAPAVQRPLQSGIQLPHQQQVVASAPIRLRPRWGRLAPLLLVWLLLLLASSRPVGVGEAIPMPTLARDLMLAIDLSGSMQTRDMQVAGQPVDRLSAVKRVMQPFIARREGDRLGLILFGSQAYLQSPLSFDRKSISILLDETQIAMAGRETSIGDAIGLAVKRLRDRPASSRVLILVTDGANTAGEISPLQAAQLAQREKVRIYTIGVGADEMIQPGIFGSSFGARRVNPSSDLDEKGLTEIAELTGGHYFRARNPEQLEQIYRQLDTLEPVAQEAQRVRPHRSLFHLPLGAAMGLVLLLWLGRLIGQLGQRLPQQERMP
ncbi:vWA domain-containing protein [Aestuariirhabdus litorea]|uniref:VWA domain-containing protein n=1 Tax=Aestuariirhabdus litorea TaxID=2528527 RepID=A0A3P3VQX1_9GAMM|nr:VWA domain-containing protein [Aestuariirhabdus litorea]RRJ84854.1 VWA domain-containing protein [Aestuariirhabdus litorea]RWW98081.1 VWA domain-containing protein [Endozoicomonadaceae bacterium GTF-13]